MSKQNPKGRKQNPKAGELYPHQVVRVSDGPIFFGLGAEALRGKIKSGEVPEPMLLTATGRAKGWLGQQIIDHHAAMRRLAEERRSAKKAG